jgi:Xaa-Pro dipeptidase
MTTSPEPGSDAAYVVANADAMAEVAFSRREYAHRLTRVREVMARERVDLLFLQSPESMCYLTGYESAWYQGGESPVAPVTTVVVHVDHDDFIFFDDYYHSVHSRYHTVAKDIRVHGGEYSEVFQEPFEFIASELKAEGWLPGVAGFEMGSYRPNRHYSELYQAAFEAKGATVVDATQVVREVRAVKSPHELACIETAARIADIGLQAAVDNLQPGVTELELWGAIFAAMTKAGGENMGIPMLVESGLKQVAGHSLASRKQIMPGESVFVDVCGVFNRYHADQGRMFCIGEPDQAVIDRINTAAGVFKAIEDVLRPDISVKEINTLVKAYYEDAGIWGDHSYIGGYELGIAFPPDWVGAFNYGVHDLDDDRPLVPGSVVNHESQYYLPNLAGFSILVDTIRVREHDAGFVSKFPHELAIVG